MRVTIKTACVCMGILALFATGCKSMPQKEADNVTQTVVEATTGAAETAYTDIDQYMKIISVDSVSSSDDGTTYFMSWPTGLEQIYRVTENEPKAITTAELFPEGVDFFSVSRDGRFMVIGADQGGNEQFDIYVMNLETPGAPPQKVDVDPAVRADSILISPTSDFVLYRSTRRDGKNFDVWRFTFGSESPHLVIQREGYIWLDDISQNGKHLLFTTYYGGHSADLFLADLDTQEARQLTTAKTGLFMAGRFAIGARAYMLTDEGLDMIAVAELNLENGEWTKRSSVQWSVETLAVDQKNDRLAFTYNEHGYSRLAMRKASDFSDISVPDLPEGAAIVSALELTESSLTLIGSSADRTNEVYRLSFGEPAFEQLTHSSYAGIDTEKFVRPDLVMVKSFDGVEIPTFVYRPKTEDSRLTPYVIYAHGGPESQFRPQFVRNFQHLLERGIGVVAPNVRGSSGYTREYIQLDDYKNRMDSIRDFKAVADWLVATKIADPKRVGIYGGSYGGFVVMAAITEYPKTFAAAINKVGIVNFVSFLKNTKGYRRKVREMEYGPLSDEEFLKSISPINKIDRVQTPLMLVHGENDPRVPVGEARQIIEALTARNVPVQALIFEDEGHGLAKLDNRLEAYRAMADFWMAHLKPDAETH